MYSKRGSEMATSIRLEPETEHRLDALAAQTGRSKSYYLRELIERGIADLEDYYLATDVLERIRKGEESILSSEEIWRGMDD
jgi:RHH-type rel operon transcriptional repressor/antitoxin RelB